ncbi:hypothetical protein ABEB36_001461 [Hypothenemus hampei]|uniref:Odorant receptor n=1 Tax=Hypothenemus hampei TaxID=57062 RepID=A0ABD1FFJ4_HYPHA
MARIWDEMVSLGSKFFWAISPRNIQMTNVKDKDYEFFPGGYIFGIEFFCYQRILYKLYWLLLYLNLPLLFMELWCFVNGENPSMSLIVKHQFTIVVHVTGILFQLIIMQEREKIYKANETAKKLQWSLNFLNSKVKRIVAMRSVAINICMTLSYFVIILYLYNIPKEIQKSLLMQKIVQLNQNSLTYTVLGMKLLNIIFLNYFIILMPLVHIYFTLEGEFQVFLLAEYVSKLIFHLMRTGGKANGKFVSEKLRKIVKRQNELKQFYLDNEKLVNTAGIKFLFIMSLYVAIIIYAIFEKALETTTIISCILMAFLNTVCATVGGQRYEDQIRVYAELCKMPWYDWSNENKRFYQLILIGSSKIPRVAIFQDTYLNYSLGLKVG